jgi:hypothetical protein
MLTNVDTEIKEKLSGLVRNATYTRERGKMTVMKIKFVLVRSREVQVNS